MERFGVRLKGDTKWVYLDASNFPGAACKYASKRSRESDAPWVDAIIEVKQRWGGEKRIYRVKCNPYAFDIDKRLE